MSDLSKYPHTYDIYIIITYTADFGKLMTFSMRHRLCMQPRSILDRSGLAIMHMYTGRNNNPRPCALDNTNTPTTTSGFSSMSGKPTSN